MFRSALWSRTARGCGIGAPAKNQTRRLPRRGDSTTAARAQTGVDEHRSSASRKWRAKDSGARVACRTCLGERRGRLFILTTRRVPALAIRPRAPERDEANLPAKETQACPHARVPCAYAYACRPPYDQAPS